MSVARKIAYNTAIQVVGRLIGLAITLVTVNFIANHLVVDGSALRGYGQYTIIFTYVSILGAAADFGLFTLVVREISGKSKEEAGRIIANGLGFRLLLFLVSIIIFCFLYVVLPYQEVVRQGILLGVVVAFSMLFSQMVATIFQAHLLADRIVIAETTGKLLTAAGTILALKAGYGLLPIVGINLAGQLLTLFISYLLAKPLVKIRIQFDTKLWRQLLPQFLTIAVINLLALVHFKTDTLLLTFYKPETDVGVYGVAYKILEVILVIPSIFATNLLPVLTTFIVEGRDTEVGQVIKRSSSLLFIAASYLVVFVAGFAPWIIVFITQPDFIVSAAPLRILTVSIFFVFLTTLLSQAVIASRDQKVLVRGYIMVVILNVVLNIYAIPRWSYMGAATTTAITEACLLWYTLSISKKKFSETVNWKIMAQVLLATAASFVFLAILSRSLSFSLSSFVSIGKFNQMVFLLSMAIVVAIVFLFCLWLSFGGSVKRVRQLFQIR